MRKWKVEKKCLPFYIMPSDQVFEFDIDTVFFLTFQIGDLGLAVSSMTSIRHAYVAGTRSHIPPEASSDTVTEPDEFWDIYT